MTHEKEQKPKSGCAKTNTNTDTDRSRFFTNLEYYRLGAGSKAEKNKGEEPVKEHSKITPGNCLRS